MATTLAEISNFIVMNMSIVIKIVSKINENIKKS